MLQLSLAIVVYIAFVVGPGLGLGELLAIWGGAGESLAARLATAIGLGLAVDTFVAFVKTSGLAVGGLQLFGLDAATVAAVAVGGILLAVAGVAVRRKFLFWTKPSWPELVVALLMVATAITLLAYLQVFPIFPENQSVDFAWHVRYANQLISGDAGSVASGLLYFGVHYQIAALTLLSGMDALLVARYTMVILTVLSVPVVYLCAKTLSESEKIGLATALLYAVPGTIWFGLNFNAGLYPQFFGMLISLFALTLTARFVKEDNKRGLVLPLVLTIAAGYVSHFSFLTIIPAVIFLPVVIQLRDHKFALSHWLPAAIMVVPGLVAAVRPNFLSELVGIVGQSEATAAGNVLGTTPLSSVFAPFPAIQYIILEANNDLAAAVVLLLAVALVVSLVFRFQKHPPSLLLPVVWLVTLILITPFNESAWRFSLVSLVPLTIMAGGGLVLVYEAVFGDGMKRWRKLAALIAVVLAVGVVVNGSWGAQAVVLPFNPVSSDTAYFQQAAYSTIQWLLAHTPNNSVYFSVTDWRFGFMTLDYYRDATFGLISNESSAIQAAQGYQLTRYRVNFTSTPQYNFTYFLKPEYVIVTRFVTYNLGPNPNLYPWNTFTANSNLTLIYQTQDAKVFHLTPIPACYVTKLSNSTNVRICPTG